MNGTALIGVALLILLLLPVLLLSEQGRRIPDALPATIAGTGLLFAALLDGPSGLILSALTGLAFLLLLAAGVSIGCSLLHARLLTGAHIKLLAAGAIWLGAPGALKMVLLTTLFWFAAGALLRARKIARTEPHYAIIAVAILCVQIQQAIS